MNTSPRRSVYYRNLPKLFGLGSGSGPSPTGNKNSPPRFDSHPISSGGGQDNSNKPPNLELADLLVGDMEEAFKGLAPQLYPLVEKGKGPLDAAANNSRELKKNCFCLIQLKSYEPKKPDWVFGRIKTSIPENTIPDNLSRAEFLIPDTSRSIGMLKLASQDVYQSSTVKTWYVRVSAWVEEDEFKGLNTFAGEFQNEGFHLERSTDLKALGDYVGLPWEEKRRQPWIYVVSSKWLSKLGTYELNAVKANLRLLLQYGNRIILNLLSDSARSLNRSCDLKQGRDRLAFQEAETTAELRNMLPDLFTNLIQSPLKDLV